MTRTSVVTTVPLAGRQHEVTRSVLEEPHLEVGRISRAVDFYLAVGCEVGLVADGWVRLRQAEARFVLVQGCGTRSAPSVVLSLTSPDLTVVRRRLLALGIRTSPIACCPTAPHGVIHVRDPDLHTVVITRTVPA